MTEEKKIYVREFDPDLRAPQVIHDWSGTARVIRYVGRCIICVRPTFEADDGGNDPRGVMGDYANQGLDAKSHGMVGDDVVLCWRCGNEEGSYKRAVWLAAHHYWQHPSDIAEDDENQYDSY